MRLGRHRLQDARKATMIAAALVVAALCAPAAAQADACGFTATAGAT